ncbi:MAG: DNA methyltransferase, partial [Clostridia bacterium]
MNYSDLSKEELIQLLEESETTSGKYGLIWDREKEPEQIVSECYKSIPILNNCETKNINNNGINNILIEGDNFHSLSVLNYTHREKIDVIYIDPPYNTGNRDFIYNDDFINMEDGYRHSKWLNFMSKRLRLARNLLSENGVIFISIDDNEYAQLRLLCDSIFGQINFIANIIWEKAYSPVNLKKHFSENHDYILCFAKNKSQAICNGLQRNDEANSRYKNLDNDPRGPWKSSDLSVGPIIKDKVYEIKAPSGRKVMPPKGYCWRLTKERFEEYVTDNRIWFGPDGNNVPSIKRFLSEVKGTMTPMTIWKYTDVGHSQDATQKLKDMFDGQAVFDYPKPVGLIKRIIELYSKKDSIVLDFFAGTGTTGQAVLELNQEDDGNRQFILCTNNENRICENVTYPRLKKIFNGYKNNKVDFKKLVLDASEFGVPQKRTRIIIVAYKKDLKE